MSVRNAVSAVLLCFTALLLGAPTAGADASPNPYGIGDTYPLQGPCYSVAIADFDGRNGLDLAAAEQVSNSVSVWLNDGSGHFTPGRQVPLEVAPRRVVTADFDRDGHADLAVVLSADSGSVRVFRGLGDGSFAAPLGLSVGDRLEYLAAGDLDNDGWPDLVATGTGTGSSSGGVWVLANHGGSFAPAEVLQDTFVDCTVAITDTDRDGWPDLVVSRTNGTVLVEHNLGNGSFMPTGEYLIEDCFSDILAADLDGDGFDDLAVVGDGAYCNVLWNDGEGRFGRLDSYSMRGFSRSLASCDLYVGEPPALAVARIPYGNYDPGRIALVRASRAQGLVPTMEYWFGAEGYSNAGGPGFVGFADLDGDGQSDMIVARWQPGGGLSVLRRLGGATFAGVQYFTFPDLGLPRWPATVDFHATGKTDLMGVAGGRLVVIPSRDDGTLGSPEDLGAADAFGAIDLNGDGRTDVVTRRDSVLAVRYCGSDATLGLPTFIPGKSLLCTGDFDGDRHPDLLVALGGDSTAILLNDGGNGFHSPTPANVVPPPYVVSDDFDGDGLGDLAWGYRRGTDCDTVVILHGDGRGTFTFLSGQLILVGRSEDSGPRLAALTAADLNGDGLPDLVALGNGGSEPGTACVLLNLGSGTLAPEGTYEIPREQQRLLVADFDRDGLPDMASTGESCEGGRIMALMNRGDGTFQPQPILGLLNYPQGIVLGDFDGNGMPDVAVTYGSGASGTGVCILVNRLTAGNTTPVLLSLVEATVEDGTVRLRWYSARPGLAARVERCEAAGKWGQVGNIRADEAGVLDFADAGVTAGTHYGYRLSIRVDGRDEVSGVTWLDVPETVKELAVARVSPNPSATGWTMSLLVPSRTTVSVQLHDLAGRQLLRRDLGGLAPGRHDVLVGEGLHLVPGVYWLRVTQAGREVRAKAVVVR